MSSVDLGVADYPLRVVRRLAGVIDEFDVFARNFGTAGDAIPSLVVDEALFGAVVVFDDVFVTFFVCR